MRLLTGTVLPLTLAYCAVVVLLLAGRRPAFRRAPARPAAALLSICAGGYVFFAAAMSIYCVAQPRGAVRCVRDAWPSAGMLAIVTVVPALAFTLIASRRRSRTGARRDLGGRRSPLPPQ